METNKQKNKLCVLNHDLSISITPLDDLKILKGNENNENQLIVDK